MSSRRLRAFKRWMKSQSIEYSEALELIETPDSGIAVKALCDLNEGDIVAKIPKNSCLTVKTSSAREMIEEFELGGSLALSMAVMYEKSLGEKSMWDGYLQVLPERECVPLVWTLDEVDRFLVGTELHKTLKEDKNLMYEDWKACIFPLITSEHMNLDPGSFGVEQYFTAKSLVASRSFEIDDYHGYGMVPLADLFNHKTGAENVHITNISSDSGSDNDDNTDDHNGSNSYDIQSTESPPNKNNSPASLGETSHLGSDEMDLSSSSGDDPTTLEMIIVKDAKAGDEVFNTYGYMGNAALLHRYGFTEADNPYDIVNIDLNLVIEWSSSSFSSRYSRSRILLWRRLDCSGCVSQDSEYFEISADGEPQLELLVLLYIMFLPDEVYFELNKKLPSNEDIYKAINILLSDKNKKTLLPEAPETAKTYLLTSNVCNALLSLADIRESLYGTNSLDEDEQALSNCSVQERKLYHSLVLRVRERTILKNLRTYASSGSHRSKKMAFVRKT